MPETFILLIGTVLYAVAAGWAVARAGRIRAASSRGPESILVAAVLSFLAFLVWRAAKTGEFPTTDLGESFAFLALAVGILYLALIREAYRVLGAFVLPIGAAAAIVSAVAVLVASPNDRRFETVFLALHATSSFAAYAAFIVSSGASVAYLIQERSLRRKSFGRLSQGLPSLSDLDALSYRAVALGFPLLTFGMVIGSVWASRRWGSFWVWEPKLALSLLLWLLGAAIFHLRTIEKHQGRRTAILTIAVAVMVVIVLVGPSLFAGGRHAFL